LPATSAGHSWARVGFAEDLVELGSIAFGHTAMENIAHMVSLSRSGPPTIRSLIGV